MVTLHTVSLVFGLASVGSLFLAVTTDYWLYTSEPFDFEKMILEGQAEITGEEFPPDVLQVRIHLYRVSSLLKTMESLQNRVATHFAVNLLFSISRVSLVSSQR